MPIYTIESIDGECRIKTQALRLDRKKWLEGIDESEIDQDDEYFPCLDI